ncbi:alpha/beta hydrolase [Bifidobacterium animalis subsp. animalis MCC 0499]|uniref:HAD family hydrolase n=1 Tax=Bifidobacterium animalis TaxID=28025 RepID=UPI00069B3692|nr:alpha/beta hydrolase [Bifidobacterium animalis]KOA61705.1 alpha/beta hydrolase [Bifidobacterium animalis subsp. animalis MCC 0499]
MQTDFSAVVFDYFDVLVDWRPRRVVGAFYPPGVTDMFFDDRDPHGYEFCRVRAAAGVPDGKILDDYTREHGPAVGWILRLLLQHRALGFYDMPVGMPTLLRELRGAGVRMVGLANCSETAVEQMQVKYPWLGLLDGTMVSARECIAKPESALFERAIRAFHLDPAHTLFVENNAANVAAACELGLYAVRFESAEQIRALLLPVS